jgi:hypothetical protein
VRCFAAFKTDYAVFGVGGIDEDGTLLDFDPAEVAARESMRANCRQSLLVADASKFGRAALARGGRLASLDHLFVDALPGDEAIRNAKRRGLHVTCDTAPHYFALNELALSDYRTFAKVSPPLRAESDRRAVVAALQDGTIDAIASDHSPHDQDSKRLPLAQAAFGTVGLESLLPVTLELVHNKQLGLLDALRKVTSAPASLLGLKEGRLAKGLAADFVLFDLEVPWRIDAKALQSKSKNSAFDGRLVQGRAVRTVGVVTTQPDARVANSSVPPTDKPINMPKTAPIIAKNGGIRRAKATMKAPCRRKPPR